ncbi:MAG: MotA/TolQ/ExbB proton channel family protein [Planctomycetes bacterium]|nr:MotA/TolQ/ExbB proton channel family protein [Planctomycetota bacterium]MCB9918131.1 MotA/TolQ/ExbB proton channel family protein [Planctomycetota bacterium]
MNRSSFASRIPAFLFAAGAVCAPLFAAPQGDAPAAQEPASMLSDIVGNAGIIGGIIGILSIIALALVIEHAMSIKRDKLAPPHLIDEIEALFEEQKFQEAVEVCEAEPCFLTNTVGAGLAKLGHSYDTIQAAYEEMHDEEEIKLHQKIGWLSLIAAVSPMLGLLGTVNGMITTFGEIAAKPSVKPNDLAGGIKGALVTTLLGLVVAIPVTAAYVFFKNRVVLASLEIGAIVEELFDRFRTK